MDVLCVLIAIKKLILMEEKNKNNQVSKSLRVILMRSGIEIWLEDDRIANVQKLLITMQSHKFIEIDDRTINTADISGIFTPQDIEEMTKRKNGNWKCKTGNWHTKKDPFCECWKDDKKTFAEKYNL